MKKFLLAILSVLLLACLGAAAACSGGSPDGTYYTLVFKKTNGVTYVCDIPSGYEVLEGTTVTFSLTLAEDARDQTPVVYANDEVLEEKDGKYSFVMNGDTTVRVDGLMAQGSEYNKLVFASTPGISYRILTEGLKSGMLVKMGTQVSFSITRSENYSGTAVVYANSEALTPDANGVYTFTMDSPVTISVDGLVKNVTLTYVSGDTRVRYTDEQGQYIQTDEEISTVAGDELKFKVKISVYHVNSGFDVLANGTVLTPDTDGYYTFELTDDTSIQVRNLVEETSFVERADGGAGTINNPFRISKPIDLYQMSMLINQGFYTDGRFFAGYYELVNDIDFEGEQAYVIGDGNANGNGYAIFAGNFNGNGHTLSNFFINDMWIEQEEFSQLYLTNVGLFGIATSTDRYSPAIYNLNIDNATVSVDVSRYDSMPSLSSVPEVHVGTLIGQSYGATVSGCTVTNSTINVTGSTMYGSYAGGLIGVQLSAYSTSGTISYFSSISSCSADVDIYAGSATDYVYAAGGITGLLGVGEENLSSYILNSYSTGNIEGGVNAGGIVGYMAPGASIINCYSTGDVTASSPFPINPGITYPEGLLSANAGGIVGYAGFNTVVYNSFSTGTHYAYSAMSGSAYSHADAVVGNSDKDDSLQDAHAYPVTISGSKGVRASEVTENFIRNTMHWDEEDWTFANGAPTFTRGETSKHFTITFSAADGFGTVPAALDVNDSYMSMSRWYMTGRIKEYPEGNSGNRSYGYFFDEQLKERVPVSFVPTGDMTIYIGYKDYNEVAGTYYLGESPDIGARLEFAPDGTVTFINGALSQNATYTYDGETIVILGSALGDLSTVFDEMEIGAREREYYLSSLYNFGATVENGRISITGGYVSEVEITMVEGTDMFGVPTQTEQIAQTGESFRLFAGNAPLNGLKAIENFKYIDYYNGADGTEYSFYGNGTGVRKTNGDTDEFTFTYASDVLTITIGNSEITAEVDGDGYVTEIDRAPVMAYDGFTGAWETPFAYNVTYTFNGKSAAGAGAWEKSGVGGGATGTYTVANGKLDAGDFTAEIKDGIITITENGVPQTLYRGGSFVGEWYYSQKPEGPTSSAVTINLTLNGINSESGLGAAKALYVATGEEVDLTYTATRASGDGEYTISVYNQSENFAELTFDSEKYLLQGTLNGSAARLTAYDGIKGLWISNDDVLGTVQFNGRGFYDLAGDSALGALAVNGTVYVGTASAGKYSLDYSSMQGSFSYRGVAYTFKYDYAANQITVTASQSSRATSEPIILQQRDIWYSRPLVDGEGYVYSFDGRGMLEKGGTVTASKGDLESSRRYTYYIESNEIRLVSTEAALYPDGRIAPATDAAGKQIYQFTATNGDPVELTLSTPFTGKWIIGGEMGELEIGKIYADGSASGSYKFYGDAAATPVDFTYNEEGGYMSFPFENRTYYINALTSQSITELSVGPDNSINGSRNSVCVGENRKDKYYGNEYMIYDAATKADTGEKLVFDGLSSSLFSNGTAVLYDARGAVSAAYSYTLDAIGNVRITSGYSRYVMVEWEKDSEVDYTALNYVHAGDSYYAILYPDSLYGVTIKDRDTANVSYEFNGVGSVTRHNADGTTDNFAYYVILADNMTNRHILRFTDAADKIYTVTLDQSANNSSDWTVKMSEPDEFFAVNPKDSVSETATYLFDGAGRVIRLTTSTEESAVNYSYVLESKEGGKAVFTFTTADGDEYTAVLDQSSANKEEWTLTLTAKD